MKPILHSMLLSTFSYAPFGRMMHSRLNLALWTSLSIAVGLISCSLTANAANKLGAEVEAGLEYDSNLAVVELDQYTSRGDWALLANLRLNAQWQATPKAVFKAGASYNSKTYQELSAFDLDIQQVFADASYELPLFKLGLSYHQADAALDGTDFLTLRQHSVYLSRLFNQRTFVRGAVNYQEKEFPTSPERNAHNLGMAGDVFVFFRQGKTFLTLGVVHEQEDAASAAFDLTATSLKTAINHQFPAWGKTTNLQLGWRYEQRDYSGITPAIKAKRDDSRQVLNLEWQIHSHDWLTWVTKLEAGDYQSNLSSADYTETRASLMLKARF